MLPPSSRLSWLLSSLSQRIWTVLFETFHMRQRIWPLLSVISYLCSLCKILKTKSEMCLLCLNPHAWPVVVGVLQMFIRCHPGTALSCGSAVKNLPADPGDIGDMGSVPGSGRSPGGGNGNWLQYSCLGNLMDRGAWWAIVHGIAKSWTQLSN